MNMNFDKGAKMDIKNNIECYFIRKDSFDYITYECSNCEEEWCLADGTPEENCYNYCPECGAKITKVIECEEQVRKKKIK